MSKLQDFGQGFFWGEQAKLIEFPVLQSLRIAGGGEMM